jgi:hypothetical protein
MGKGGKLENVNRIIGSNGSHTNFAFLEGEMGVLLDCDPLQLAIRHNCWFTQRHLGLYSKKSKLSADSSDGALL